MATTTEQQGPGPVATVTKPGDNQAMPLTAAERQARLRARRRAGEILPTCSSCGAKLQPALRERPDRVASGLCWSCWIASPQGLSAERARGQRNREADLERARELGRERARRFRQRASQASQGERGTKATQDGPEAG
ncbi:hypothetical protein KBZ12_10835 [Cyanobium sp. Cruz CV13-4-11]|jgi:hypothetical protein|uniref:hypothetical protein n=1 Tax=unclassified Cyanobium TaxID=2627006 RepID=UPI0020CCBDE5|nr:MULTISPECIES: hypothetical protein [unclassified Cyanobium]MCP9901735.1 hypothetical protein [Cyanobium sp. Cruz CV11-17]MCP9919965.1 hypothetical protein [Cyanobium sp. Cruz CV13-4-11]